MMRKLLTAGVMLLSSLWAIAADGVQWTDIWPTATAAYLEGGEYQWTDGAGNRQTERCKENTTIDGSTITVNLNHAFNGAVDLRFFTKLNLESSKIYKISYKLSSTQDVRIERPAIYCDGSALNQGAYQKSNIEVTANATPVEVVFDVDHVGSNNGRGVCIYLRPSNWADNTVLTISDVKFEYMGATGGEAPEHLYLLGTVDGMSDYADAPEFKKDENVFTVNATITDGGWGVGYFFLANEASATPLVSYVPDKNRMPVSVGTPVTVAEATSATQGNVFSIAPGSYQFKVEFTTDAIKLTAAKTTGIKGTDVDDSVTPPVYYDLSGHSVANPTNGVYIRKAGSSVEKVIK